MADFGEWLIGRKDNDSGLKILQKSATEKADKWQAASLEGYAAIAAAEADEASRNLAMRSLGQYHERWLQQGKPSKPYGLIALSIGSLLLAGCLFYGVFISSTFMPSLGEIDQARGLITFLFAFGTIGVAIIMSVSVIWMDVSEIEARITKAKDLLAILMGVLGTIVGFYFGTATGTPTKVAVAEVTLQPASTTPGNRVTVSTKISGGVGPYHYDIIVTDPTNKVATAGVSVLGKISATGEISEQLPVLPKDALGNLDVKVSVVDSKGIQGVSKSVTLKVTAQPTPADAKAPDAVKPPVAAATKQPESVKPPDTAAPPAQPAAGATK